MSRLRQETKLIIENGGSRMRLCAEKVHKSRISLVTQYAPFENVKKRRIRASDKPSSKDLGYRPMRAVAIADSSISVANNCTLGRTVSVSMCSCTNMANE